MNFFEVSRLNTDLGIFRVTGDWSIKSPNIENMHIKSIEILGTDGWVLLKKQSQKNAVVLETLLPQVLSHLLSQSYE